MLDSNLYDGSYIQHVFDEENHFNELKILISSIIPRILNVYQVKKQGGLHQFKRVPQLE